MRIFAELVANPWLNTPRKLTKDLSPAWLSNRGDAHKRRFVLCLQSLQNYVEHLLASFGKGRSKSGEVAACDANSPSGDRGGHQLHFDVSVQRS
jgi:hypothetical protein